MVAAPAGIISRPVRVDLWAIHVGHPICAEIKLTTSEEGLRGSQQR